MVDKKIILDYLAQNKRLCLVNDEKKPIVKDWVNQTVPKEKLLEHKKNISWVIDKDNLVVDVDPRNGGKESFKKLCKDIDFNLPPSVVTPSGGFHVYLRIPEKHIDKKIKKSNQKYPGIDFLSIGSQCMIPSSKTKKGVYYWYQSFNLEKIPFANDELIEIITSEKREKENLNKEEFYQTQINRKIYTKKQIEEAVNELNPSMKHNDWIKVGMAIFDWDIKEGLAVWENWSKKGNNYTAGETEKRWKTFNVNGEITLSTLFYMKNQIEYDAKISKMNDIVLDISSSNQKDIEINIFPKIKKIKDQLDYIQKETLYQKIKERYKALTNTTLSIKQIRKIIEQEPKKNIKKPDWVKNWVYINNKNKFVHLKTLESYNAEGFNVINGKHLEFNDESYHKPTAVKFVSDNGFVDVLDSTAYLPTIDKRICEIEGKKILNCFNPKTIPKEASSFTEKGKESIKRIQNHIRLLFETDENSHIFTQWLAHQIQNPGEQILWTPIIQSIEGIGKSFFGELLRACLGDVNVGIVSPSQVINTFNGWATNKIVNVLEELRIKGKNRYEVINALKPLITDRMIQINDKGISQYTTYNTTNYICFTNYKDALPLDVNDRRWWVIFAQIEHIDDITSIMKEPKEEYFQNLFGCLRENRKEIRLWLLKYPISKEFKQLKQAPMTNYKKMMIENENDIDGLLELEGLIEEGGNFYTVEALSSNDLFNDFIYRYPRINLSPHQKNRMLEKLNYYRLGYKKIDDKKKIIWVKNKNTSLDEACQIVKKTSENNQNHQNQTIPIGKYL